MLFKNSVKYKLLRLVCLQAGLFVLVLASLWLINPRWVFWHQVESPHITESLKAFKHHYGMLNTLNLNLAKLRAHSAPRANELEKIGIELHQQIQGIKSASLTAQQHFKLDFTVLINFLFNYKSKVATLDPTLESYDQQLWDTLIYFSRIQSEFFYIVDEIERFDSEKAAQELKNAQNSLLIWGLTSLMIIILGFVIALNYARIWQKQIANLLNQVYRLSADDYTLTSEEQSDDELGYLARAFGEAVDRIKKKNA